MNDIIIKLGECVEFGKISLASPYPPAMKGQPGADELTREALENGFGKQVVQGYSNVIAALKQGYASIGYERGRNVLVSLNKFLVDKRMIVKEGKGYRYNPDFHY